MPRDGNGASERADERRAFPLHTRHHSFFFRSSQREHHPPRPRCVRLTAEGLMLLVGGSVVLGAGKKDASPHVLGAAQLEILRFYCEHGEHGSTPPCENFEVMKAVKLGTRKPRSPRPSRRTRRRP